MMVSSGFYNVLTWRLANKEFVRAKPRGRSTMVFAVAEDVSAPTDESTAVEPSSDNIAREATLPETKQFLGAMKQFMSRDLSNSDTSRTNSLDLMFS